MSFLAFLLASVLVATPVLSQSCTYYGTSGTCRDTSLCTGAFGASSASVTGCQSNPVRRIERKKRKRDRREKKVDRLEEKKFFFGHLFSLSDRI
jgi:hypothetical protein